MSTEWQEAVQAPEAPLPPREQGMPRLHAEAAALDHYTLLHQLIQICSSGCDPAGFVRTLRALLPELLPCERLTILLHEAQSRYFYAPPEFMAIPADDWPILPEAETTLSEILLTQRALLYLAQPESAEPLPPRTPRERKIFGATKVSEMTIPVVVRQQVMGVLHFADAHYGAFSPGGQLLAEQLAGLFALVLERVRTQETLARVQEKASRWQQRYWRAFDKSSLPLLLLRPENSLVYAANRSFARLAGVPAGILPGQDFVQLFAAAAQNQVRDFLHALATRVPATAVQVNLQRPNGAAILVRLSGQRWQGKHDLVELALTDLTALVRERWRQQQRTKKLLRFMRRQIGAPVAAREAHLTAGLAGLGKILSAKYAALFLSSTSPSVRVHLAAALQFKERALRPLPASWRNGLEQGPYAQLLLPRVQVASIDIKTDARFEQSRPIAQTLGYTNIVAVTLAAAQKPLGLVVLFLEDAPLAEDEPRDLLMEMAYVFSQTLAQAEELAARQTLVQKQACWWELAQALNRAQGLEEALQSFATGVGSVAPFEELRISIFPPRPAQSDLAPESERNFVIASRDIAEDWPAVAWQAFAEQAEYGWRLEKGAGFQKNGRQEVGQDHRLNTTELFRSGFHYHTQLDLPLLTREVFLGTVSVRARASHAFSAEQEEFINQVLTVLALALDRLQLDREACAHQHGMQACTEMVQRLAQTPADEFLETLLQAVQEKLRAQASGLKILHPHYACLVRHPLAGLALAQWPEVPPAQTHQIFTELPNAPEGVAAAPNAADENTAWEFSRSPTEGGLYLHNIVVGTEAVATMGFYWEAQPPAETLSQSLLAGAAHLLALYFAQQAAAAQLLAESQRLASTTAGLQRAVLEAVQNVKSPLQEIERCIQFLDHEPAARVGTKDLAPLRRLREQAESMRDLLASLLEAVKPLALLPASSAPRKQRP